MYSWFLASRDKNVREAYVIALPSASAAWTKIVPYLANQKWYGFHIAYVYSLWQVISHGTVIFDLDLEVWPNFEKTLTLAAI